MYFFMMILFILDYPKAIRSNKKSFMRIFSNENISIANFTRENLIKGILLEKIHYKAISMEKIISRPIFF